MRRQFLFAVLTVCLSACAPYQRYTDAEAFYAQGNYERAEAIFADYAKQPNAKRYEAAYYQAVCLAKTGYLEDANKILANAARFCDDRQLRMKMLLAQAEIMRRLPDLPRAEAIYADLRHNYYDIFTPEMIDATRAEFVLVNPLGSDATVAAIDPYLPAPLYRVRLSTTYVDRASALAATYRLAASGIETAVSQNHLNGRGVYAVQIGAFRNRHLAEVRAEQARQLGFGVLILEVK
ncbi:hypothetical protein FACS1894139_07500 [Planctomycetales bacterium]|nr:hypothetical protein FACS1894107_16030 [Planctomycetales bacterium]GHT04778.1 hypothetical protein FACS1894139_07500 [Planctomycetales bacterium]GHV23699.1 hypothetical protein AGMMS49959_17610 [Planctomycetales bacterium]